MAAWSHSKLWHPQGAMQPSALTDHINPAHHTALWTSSSKDPSPKASQRQDHSLKNPEHYGPRAGGGQKGAPKHGAKWRRDARYGVRVLPPRDHHRGWDQPYSRPGGPSGKVGGESSGHSDKVGGKSSDATAKTRQRRQRQWREQQRPGSGRLTLLLPGENVGDPPHPAASDQQVGSQPHTRRHKQGGPGGGQPGNSDPAERRAARIPELGVGPLRRREDPGVGAEARPLGSPPPGRPLPIPPAWTAKPVGDKHAHCSK